MGQKDANQGTDVSPQGLLNMQTFGELRRPSRKVRKGHGVYMLDKVIHRKISRGIYFDSEVLSFLEAILSNIYYCNN